MVDWKSNAHLVSGTPGFVFSDMPAEYFKRNELYKSLYQRRITVTDRYFRKLTIVGPKLTIITFNRDAYQEFRYGLNLEQSVLDTNYIFVEMTHKYI